MKLIDADILIKKCKEISEDEWNQRVAPACWACAYEEFADELENADEVGGWISVKDRLPEQAGYRCLVSAEYGDGKHTVFTAFTGYGELGWWTYESVYMEKVRKSDNRVHHNYHITHWMPLPEPPKI